MPSITFGDRLREARKRAGYSQQELAGHSGVSLSLIRKLEQGEREDTRLETARALASSLRVPTSRLIAGHTEEGADPATVDQWAAVRYALVAHPTRDDVAEAPTVSGLQEAFSAALPLRAKHRFAELSGILPPLVRDAEILAGITPEGRALRFRVASLCAWLLTMNRHFTEAEDLISHHLQDAPDGVQAAAMVNTMSWLLLRQGRLGEARALAVKWADETEPHRLSRATADELSAWGWMLLRVSNSSVRDAREGEAVDALRLAAAAAAAMGREVQSQADPMRTFGPTTVALKEAENAMIMDQPDRVLQLSAPLDAAGMRPMSLANWNRHRLDVANAKARTRDYAGAIGTMLEVWESSPEWLPQQRYARDILGRIVGRRRTLTPEMRQLTEAVRLPL